MHCSALHDMLKTKCNNAVCEFLNLQDFFHSIVVWRIFYQLVRSCLQNSCPQWTTFDLIHCGYPHLVVHIFDSASTTQREPAPRLTRHVDLPLFLYPRLSLPPSPSPLTTVKITLVVYLDQRCLSISTSRVCLHLWCFYLGRL